MNLRRCVHMAVVLALVVTMLEVEAKKCKKGDKKERAKCRRKRVKSSKTRTIRSDKSKVAPYWRRRPPKETHQAVREGSDIIFNCAIRGSPTPAFSWLRDGRSVKRKSKKYRQRKGRLVIKSVEVSDSSQYTCIAKNELGTLNFTYSLHVLENMPLKDIEVVAAPENQTAHTGDTVIFHCRSEDWPKPRVNWIKQRDSHNIIEAVSPKGNNSEELVLRNVTKADSGTYTCAIGNGMVNKELSARLTVIDEDEKLPFEPPCSLHIRHDFIVDHTTGCRTPEPVKIYYCMGSCGRSYYVPQVVTSDTPQTVIEHGGHLNQTCRCCVGVMGALSLVEMDCPLNIKKRAFYQKLRDCQCANCSTQETVTPAPANIDESD